MVKLQNLKDDKGMKSYSDLDLINDYLQSSFDESDKINRIEESDRKEKNGFENSDREQSLENQNKTQINVYTQSPIVISPGIFKNTDALVMSTSPNINHSDQNIFQNDRNFESKFDQANFIEKRKSEFEDSTSVNSREISEGSVDKVNLSVGRRRNKIYRSDSSEKKQSSCEFKTEEIPFELTVFQFSSSIESDITNKIGNVSDSTFIMDSVSKSTIEIKNIQSTSNLESMNNSLSIIEPVNNSLSTIEFQNIKSRSNFGSTNNSLSTIEFQNIQSTSNFQSMNNSLSIIEPANHSLSNIEFQNIKSTSNFESMNHSLSTIDLQNIKSTSNFQPENNSLSIIESNAFNGNINEQSGSEKSQQNYLINRRNLPINIGDAVKIPKFGISKQNRSPRINKFRPCYFEDPSCLNVNSQNLKTKKMSRNFKSEVYDLGNLSLIQPAVCLPIEHNMSDIIKENEIESTATNNTGFTHDSSIVKGENSNLLNLIKNIETKEEDSYNPECTRLQIYDDSIDAESIENAKDYEDIRNKNLFGKLIYKESNELETYNFVELVKSQLICFNSEKEPYSSVTENCYTFKSFEDSGMCFKQKFVVDLTNAKLYVSTLSVKRSFIEKWLCFCSKVNLENLVEIMDQSIYKIVECQGKYHLYLDKNENYHYLELTNLEFILYHKGNYYTFRSKNMVEFLKWVSAIQIRNRI